MGERLAAVCDSCGGPMVPDVSTFDGHDRGCGCGWICLDPRCADCHAEALEPGDLIECGVPDYLAERLALLVGFYEEQRTREWGLGACGQAADPDAGGRPAEPGPVPPEHAPAGQGARTRPAGLDSQRPAPSATGARSQVSPDPTARTATRVPSHQQYVLVAIGERLRAARAACRQAGELAAALDRDLIVSFMSNEFADGQAAKQALAVLAQLTATIGRALEDAQTCFAGIDPDLDGLRTAGDL